MDWRETTPGQDKNHLSFGIRCNLYYKFYGTLFSINKLTVLLLLLEASTNKFCLASMVVPTHVLMGIFLVSMNIENNL